MELEGKVGDEQFRRLVEIVPQIKHNQERWKSPLPEFIENLYFRRFGRERPHDVMTIEEILQKKRKKGKR